MSRKINYPIVICILCAGLCGLWLRIDGFNKLHPDNDELYELQELKRDLSWRRVLDRKQVYGDHTSFPGEYLLYKTVFSVDFLTGDISEIKLESLGNMRWSIIGAGKNFFWKVAFLKILLCVTGLVLMGVLCYKFGWAGLVGFCVYVFNPHLIYHAFDMRPYSVLPILAILSYMSAKDGWKPLLCNVLCLLCCLYHAYGLLIFILPCIYYKRWSWFFTVGIVVWCYYASFNMFGWSPNVHQAIVSPFQYFKPSGLAYVQSFLGSGLLYTGLVPLIFLYVLHWRVNWPFLTVMVVLPLVLIALVDLKTSYWIHPRQWVWVMPWFGLWVGDCLYQLSKMKEGNNER